MVIKIAGKKHWLWRAVDQDGFVLDVLVQSRRDKAAAKRLLRKLVKRQGRAPRVRQGRAPRVRQGRAPRVRQGRAPRVRQGRAPRVIITDKLKSYGAAKKEILPATEHRQHKGLNNRAENSHQVTRQRERQMKGFASPGQAQRFLSAHGPINNLFYLRRHRLTATEYRTARARAFATWREVTGLAQVA